VLITSAFILAGMKSRRQAQARF